MNGFPTIEEVKVVPAPVTTPVVLAMVTVPVVYEVPNQFPAPASPYKPNTYTSITFLISEATCLATGFSGSLIKDLNLSQVLTVK